MALVANKVKEEHSTINEKGIADLQDAIINVRCGVDNVGTMHSILCESIEDIKHCVEHFVGKERKHIHFVVEEMEKRSYVFDTVFEKLKEQVEKAGDLTESLVKN